MLGLCVITIFQVQIDIQVQSDAEAKDNHKESENFSHASVCLLRLPVAPATGHNREVWIEQKSIQNRGRLRPPIAPAKVRSGRSGTKP